MKACGSVVSTAGCKQACARARICERVESRAASTHLDRFVGRAALVVRVVDADENRRDFVANCVGHINVERLALLAIFRQRNALLDDVRLLARNGAALDAHAALLVEIFAREKCARRCAVLCIKLQPYAQIDRAMIRRRFAVVFEAIAKLFATNSAR